MYIFMYKQIKHFRSHQHYPSLTLPSPHPPFSLFEQTTHLHENQYVTCACMLSVNASKLFCYILVILQSHASIFFLAPLNVNNNCNPSRAHEPCNKCVFSFKEHTDWLNQYLVHLKVDYHNSETFQISSISLSCINLKISK